MVKTALKYHANYATIKERGVKENDKTYTLTIHKCPVLIGGYELSEQKKSIKEIISKSKNAVLKYKRGENDDIDDKRFINSISRSKNAVLQLISNNEWEYFVTLTIKRDGLNFSPYVLDEAKKVILRFFVNYSRRSGASSNFKYLLIPELHKDGAVHFHGVMSGINEKDLFINKNGYLDFKPYSDRFGYVSFGSHKSDADTNKCSMCKIKDLNKTASYISKYICKSMLGDLKFRSGMHLYYASKGLLKDRVVVKGRAVNNAHENLSKTLASFENEYCVKYVTNDLNEIKDYVEPFVSRHKNGCNIPSFSRANFYYNYRILATKLGFSLSKQDCISGNGNYKKFISFAVKNDLIGYDCHSQGSSIQRIMGVVEVVDSSNDFHFEEIPVDDFDIPPSFVSPPISKELSLKSGFSSKPLEQLVIGGSLL